MSDNKILDNGEFHVRVSLLRIMCQMFGRRANKKHPLWCLLCPSKLNYKFPPAFGHMRPPSRNPVLFALLRVGFYFIKITFNMPCAACLSVVLYSFLTLFFGMCCLVIKAVLLCFLLHWCTSEERRS